MKRVFKVRDDDCYAACIASLLEIPISKVPDFTKLRNDDAQLYAAQRWLRRQGYNMVEVVMPKTAKRGYWPYSPQKVPVYCLLTVSWQGGQWTHAVVGRLYRNRIRIVHDPDRRPSVFGRRSRYCRVAFLVPREATRISRRHRAA